MGGENWKKAGISLLRGKLTLPINGERADSVVRLRWLGDILAAVWVIDKFT